MIKDNKKLKESIQYIHSYAIEACKEIQTSSRLNIDVNNLSTEDLRIVKFIEGMTNINIMREFLNRNKVALDCFTVKAEELIESGEMELWESFENE